ncbi:hypothetical protein A1O3_10465 [Capronia epimyces CBS 606.96]|uniref:Acyl-CoA thioesterase-like C-terminal domain-containing protein n=1 Tax=Capronia epimyces CBS 606.96 TaxID=1182542 RepID=W9XA06_9EURO|nr:uncharacterized protein A1O3_10465 [Capronia epimyces CBS 606.96]EXJ77307.1 hypothetical protein A1O3_10465 [Capronia epimyces CBS 606.96]
MRKALFSLGAMFFESRLCPDGVSAQNLLGVAIKVVTTQDHLPITSKSSADWCRTRKPLSSQAEQLAGLAFLIDGALSFVPLMHDHKFLDDAAACSSLDFALRIFADDFDLNTWHLKEYTTTIANGGLTYSEGGLWDAHGAMVASMTQHNILRPKKGTGANL